MPFWISLSTPTPYKSSVIHTHRCNSTPVSQMPHMHYYTPGPRWPSAQPDTAGSSRWRSPSTRMSRCHHSLPRSWVGCSHLPSWRRRSLAGSRSRLWTRLEWPEGLRQRRCTPPGLSRSPRLCSSRGRWRRMCNRFCPRTSLTSLPELQGNETRRKRVRIR